jgi:hypothetical protein
MTPILRFRFAFLVAALLCAQGFAQTAKPKPAAPSGKPVLWRDPGAVEKLDLVGGIAAGLALLNRLSLSSKRAFPAPTLKSKSKMRTTCNGR